MSPVPASSNPIVLYDGVCALCNGLVLFVLKRDRSDRFRFAALQSDFTRTLLQKHGLNPQALETLCLVIDYAQPTESLGTRSTAVIGILRELGGFWRATASLLALVPRPLRDWGYKLVAHSRYQLFGKYDACPIPQLSDRHKFLDLT